MSTTFERSEIFELLATMERLQTQKVLELAKRLKPEITLDDLQSPHDFPELDDQDWHYEDGLLTGIQSVVSALRAKVRDQEQGQS